MHRRKSTPLTSRTREKSSKQPPVSSGMDGKGRDVSRGVRKLSKKDAKTSTQFPAEVVMNLRTLAHGLSNSLETILQAVYLLGQCKLDDNGKKWSQLSDTAAQDAARTNREIREILRSQS